MSIRRMELDLTLQGVAEVPLLGHERRRQAGRPLNEHMHVGHYELVHLMRGEQAYHIAGIGDFILRGGEALLTHPAEVHRNGWRQQGTGDLYWIQIAPPAPRTPWLGLAPPVGRQLDADLRQHPRQVVRVGDHLQEPFTALLATRAAPIHQLQHHIRCLLYAYLAAPLASDQTLSELIQRAVSMIDARLDDPIAVPDLAAELGVSASTLTRHFKQELGATPADWILRRRLEQAEQLLHAGASVIDAAIAVGFCSSQHFATQYKKIMNRRPSEDRRSKQASPESSD